MKDNELNALIMAQLLPAMQAVPDLSAVALAQLNQRRQWGVSNTAAVLFSKLFDHRLGWPKRQSKLNVAGVAFDNALIQQYETTYQFSAWVQTDPANVSGLTESDVLNIVSSIIQTDAILLAFRAAGVGIQRVPQVRNPVITDDRDRFEAVPSFDIVFTHTRILSTTVPKVDTYDANISRV